jgi:hypothetical protein
MSSGEGWHDAYKPIVRIWQEDYNCCHHRCDSLVTTSAISNPCSAPSSAARLAAHGMRRLVGARPRGRVRSVGECFDHPIGKRRSANRQQIDRFIY